MYVITNKKEWMLLLCGLLPFVFLQAQVDTTRYYRLSEVEVVEKARLSTVRESTPVQRLDKKSFERLGIQDLSEALKHFSGVSVQDYGGIGGLKTVSVRSLGAKHTAVSYDGLTVSDTQSGQVDISRFALDHIDQISLSIGQSDDIFQTARILASSGALRLQTETPRFDKKTFRLQGKVKTGSFGLFSPSLRYEQRLSENYAASFYGFWQRADGRYPYTFVNTDIVSHEKRNNSDISAWNGEFNLFANWRQAGKLHLKGYGFDSNRGLPGSVILYNDYHKERLRNRNAFLQGTYEVEIGTKNRLRIQGKYDYAWTHYRDFHSRYPGGQQTDVYTQREYYASVADLFEWTPNLTCSFAEDFFVNTLQATLPKFPFPTRISSLSALSAQYKNSRLTTTATLLGTFATETLDAGEAAPDRKRLSPAVSVSYRVLNDRNIRVRASFKEAFRLPTFNDLYYDRFGNKMLRPEKATQYNVGITWSDAIPAWRIGYCSLTVDGYYNRIKDKIVAIPTMFIWKMMNMGEVGITGIEANWSSRLDLLEKIIVLQADVSYTWQHAVDRTEKGSKIYGHQIPYTPEHFGTVSVSLENPWVNVGWTLTAVSERYALPQNIEMNRMAGYVDQQLAFSRMFNIGSLRLRAQAEILNLGNVSYDVIRHYPMPGRSFRFGLQVFY